MRLIARTPSALSLMQDAPALTATSVQNRIAPVDGLRTVAVLGVIWIHVWTFCGNPPWRFHMGRFTSPDLERVVAIVGNGVNLFFVLSGFCMYWMFSRYTLTGGFQRGFSKRMIFNRWRRLAPAFYMASLFCALGFLTYTGHFPWYDLLAHLMFLHLALPGTGGLAPPFWSLSTEWQFYLFLPLFLVAVHRVAFWPVLGLTFIASLTFRAGIYWGRWMDPVAIGFCLPMHAGEFCWGIVVAYFYARGAPSPRCLRGAGGFLFGSMVAYCGRTMMVTEVVALAGKFGPLVRVLAEPVMTLGCGMVLWNVVNSTSVFSRILIWEPMQRVGRWSYSIYLLHWWPCWALTRMITHRFGQNAPAQLSAFVLVVAIIVPMGALFYRLFEASYFQRRRVAPVSQAILMSRHLTASELDCNRLRD